MTAETKWPRRAREQGRQAFLSGRPYTDCPYLPFVDCAEGMAWKNAWLDELEKAKRAKRPSHRLNSSVENPATK